MAVVAGSISSATTTTRELILRGYEASSGRLVWESRAAGVSPFAIAIDAQRVYVAGGGGSSGAFLAAYSNETGQLLWQDRQDRTAEVLDLVADRSRLFAAGAAKGLARAHDARTGRLIWEDQTGTIDDQGIIMNPRAIDIGHDLVFIAGSAFKEFEFIEFLVRAYDATNGKLVWTDRSHRGLSLALDIAAQGNGVFAVGLASPDLVSDRISWFELTEPRNKKAKKRVLNDQRVMTNASANDETLSASCLQDALDLNETVPGRAPLSGPSSLKLLTRQR